MTKTLRLPFKNAGGKDVNILVANPKEGITKAEAVATQTLIIARNIFSSTGGDLVSAGDPSRASPRSKGSSNRFPRGFERGYAEAVRPFIVFALALVLMVSGCHCGKKTDEDEKADQRPDKAVHADSCAGVARTVR